MAKCQNCGVKFQPRFSSLEKYCWEPDCKTIEALQKLEKVKTQQVKQEKKDWQQKKAKLKKEMLTVQDWIKIAQQAFNGYIRERDKNKPCISCGKPLKHGNIDAGHLWSAGGHANLRFHEFNVNNQCSRPCNKDKSGDINNYRIGFIQRYGEKELLELDSNAHEERKFTIEELKEITVEYKMKLKELINK